MKNNNILLIGALGVAAFALFSQRSPEILSSGGGSIGSDGGFFVTDSSGTIEPLGGANYAALEGSAQPAQGSYMYPAQVARDIQASGDVSGVTVYRFDGGSDLVAVADLKSGATAARAERIAADGAAPVIFRSASGDIVGGSDPTISASLSPEGAAQRLAGNIPEGATTRLYSPASREELITWRTIPRGANWSPFSGWY